MRKRKRHYNFTCGNIEDQDDIFPKCPIAKYVKDITKNRCMKLADHVDSVINFFFFFLFTSDGNFLRVKGCNLSTHKVYKRNN
jgi:hypothetical protein